MNIIQFPRHYHASWLGTLIVLAGCSGASPTEPSPPAVAPVSVSLTVSHAARMSVSEPVLCPGDRASCPTGRQEQGPLTMASLAVQVYSLAPGAYRITGVLEPTTSAGATVSIQLGLDPVGAVRVGVAREAPHAGFVAHSGDLVSLPGVTPLVCGASFFNPSGALEWSLMFRVVDSPSAATHVCGS